jgi:L-threonylcarbamoyladenylate synthase
MPRVLPCDRRHPPPEVLAEAARVIRGGGLVAFPTETVYGLGAFALDEKAIARVFAAKGRPVHHPLIAHVGGDGDARALALSWPRAASLLAGAFWPGPLTIVVDRAPHVPAAVSGGTSSIAVRVPSHPVARALIAAVAGPVAAPSANRYQGLSPTTAAHVVKELGERVDLVLDAGPCDEGIESTVVDVRSIPPRVLRHGALGYASLSAVVPDVQARTDDPAAPETRASPGMDARHYAPRAPLTVASTREGAVAMARKLSERQARQVPVGLIVRDGAGLESDEAIAVRVLPEDAAEFGRLLYGTLHDLDDAGVAAIVVHAVPDDPSWWAIADRLARGSAPGT